MKYEQIIKYMNKDGRPKKTRTISYKEQILIYIDNKAPNVVTPNDIERDLKIKRRTTITLGLNQLLRSQVILRTKTGFKSTLTTAPTTIEQVKNRIYDSRLPDIWNRDGRATWMNRDISIVHED